MPSLEVRNPDDATPVRSLTTPIVIALVHRPTALLWSEYGDLMRIDGLSRTRSLRLLFTIGRGSLLTAFLAATGAARSLLVLLGVGVLLLGLDAADGGRLGLNYVMPVPDGETG